MSDRTEDNQWRPQRFRGGWALVRGPRGNRNRVQINESTREGAERVAKDWNIEAEERKLGQIKTVEQIYDLYLIDREKHGKNTKRMREAWKPMKPHFAHLNVGQIEEDTVNSYTEIRRRHGVSNGCIRTELAYLRQSLITAKKRKIISDAPDIPRPPAGQPRERYLTREEVARLIDAAVAFHIKLFIHLAIACAGRPKHILELTWDRVDFKRGMINLFDPDQDVNKKGRAQVPMGDEIRETLLFARGVAETDFVIEFDRKPVKSIRKGLESAARRAGLSNVSSYIFRHSAAVWMAEDGHPMSEIAQVLGHTDSRITEKHYARYSPDYLRGAVSSLRIRPVATPKRIEDESNENE